MIATYGKRVTKLVLQDCDLDDKQLDIIISGFTKLVYLDISGNHIINSEPLKRICDTIQVIKIGPRLISDNISIKLPLNSIVSGNGRKVKELHIQGFLTQQISCVSKLIHLNTLVIKFIKPLFDDQDMDYFSAISAIKTLQCLEIYQV
jgi:Leucine-rich repeat (LRR) protein